MSAISSFHKSVIYNQLDSESYNTVHGVHLLPKRPSRDPESNKNAHKTEHTFIQLVTRYFKDQFSLLTSCLIACKLLAYWLFISIYRAHIVALF